MKGHPRPRRTQPAGPPPDPGCALSPPTPNAKAEFHPAPFLLLSPPGPPGNSLLAALGVHVRVLRPVVTSFQSPRSIGPVAWFACTSASKEGDELLILHNPPPQAQSLPAPQVCRPPKLLGSLRRIRHVRRELQPSSCQVGKQRRQCHIKAILTQEWGGTYGFGADDRAMTPGTKKGGQHARRDKLRREIVAGLC